MKPGHKIEYKSKRTKNVETQYNHLVAVSGIELYKELIVYMISVYTISQVPSILLYIDNLCDVTSIADTVFTITGDCSTILHWEDYGFRMTIQVNSLPANKSCDVAVKALLGGPFKLPDGYILVSAVYAISLTRKLLKPAILEIQHCVDIQDKQHSKSLHFITASCSQKVPYEFTVDPSGHFYPGSQYATVYRQTFSMTGAAYKPELSTVDGTYMYMYCIDRHCIFRVTCS